MQYIEKNISEAKKAASTTIGKRKASEHTGHSGAVSRPSVPQSLKYLPISILKIIYEAQMHPLTIIPMPPLNTPSPVNTA